MSRTAPVLTYFLSGRQTHLPGLLCNQAKTAPIDPNDSSVVHPDVFKK
jgi:hypothetical protein